MEPGAFEFVDRARDEPRRLSAPKVVRGQDGRRRIRPLGKRQRCRQILRPLVDVEDTDFRGLAANCAITIWMALSEYAEPSIASRTFM